MINIIAAITNDLGLGRQGQLLFHISADLRRFKALTMGHPIIMGRNTFESFPNGPLPGRRNLVITSNPDYNHPGIEVYHSLEEALSAVDCNDDCFIIGGGRVYRDAMPLADRLLLTHIEAPSPAGADTYFPAINPGLWQLTDRSDSEVDPRSNTRYHFATYSRL